jgi:aminoglycoside phosphotransferase (APT) family kinase protein
VSCPTPLLRDPRAFEDGLAAVPGWGHAPSVDSVTPLGRTGPSASFRVTTSAGAWMLRVVHDPDLARLLGVDPLREQRLQQCAAAAGIAPPLTAAGPAGRWQLRPWIDGRAWSVSDLDAAPARARLGSLLRRLHELPPPAPAVATLDPLAVARAWCQRLGEAASCDSLNEISGALARIDSTRRRVSIFHSDLHAGNVIDAGDRLWLIDWEYAHVGDPLCDVAALLASAPQLRSHAAELLQALRLADCVAPGELEAWVVIYRRINSLWQRLAWAS